MTDDTRPPADMEYKGAATLLAPRPGVTPPATSTVAPEGIVELIAAVTGIVDDVGDIIWVRLSWSDAHAAWGTRLWA